MRPHSRFRRLASLLLALLVLTTSVGFTVQRLTCRMSGRSQVAVSVAGQPDLRGCLGAPAHTATFKDNCCDFSIQVHKLAVPVHKLTAHVLVAAPLLAVLPARSWHPAARHVGPRATAARWLAADSSPPYRAGRDLLAFVCRLVV